MSLKIEENKKRDNKKYKEWSQNFGSFLSLDSSYKNEDQILHKIFISRSNKTTMGCPNCGNAYHNFKRIKGKRAFGCKCGKEIVFPLVGTHLENCKIPLNIIIELIYDMLNNKNGLPARNRSRYYGFTDETSHKLLMKLSDWMGHCMNQLVFTPGSVIELDEVYPKFITGMGPYIPLKKGEGSQRTHGVLVMCERGGISKAIAYDKTNKYIIEKLIKELIDSNNRHSMYTDESTKYNFLHKDGYHHLKVTHGIGNYVTGEVHTNTAEGFNSYIKNNIHYVHKGVHPEYLQLYLNRFSFINTIRGKSFSECIEMLINSLPPLNEKVKRNVMNRKRKNTNINYLIAA